MTDGSVVLAIIRLLVSLAVVLVLLVGLARWASKRGIGSARPGKATVDVEVLTRRSLGRNSTLQVVKVGTQVMVLGVTERGVSVLGELGDEDLVHAASPLSVVPSAAPVAISSIAPTATVSSIAPTSPFPVPTASAAGAHAGVAFAAPALTATSLGATALAAAPQAAPALPRSTTWAEAENRALMAAGLQTRSGARAAREAGRARQQRRLQLPLGGLAGAPRPARQSRTIVPPTDSRSARRAAASAPTGWPWNAASVVLGVAGRSRRG